MTSIDALINRQFMRWETERQKAEDKTLPRPSPLPIVTISRQTGSRGSYFASRLAQKMDYLRLHREIIDAICNSSGFREKIVESLDSHFRGNLELMVESIFTGQSVDHGDYLRHLVRVILSMSRLGGVILIGRGGNFILGPDRGFHIRFIAPRQTRIENLQKYKGLERIEAESIIDRSDKERRHFISKIFDADIDDPHNYDLVINSSYMDIEDLVEVTLHAVNAKFAKLKHLDAESA